MTDTPTPEALDLQLFDGVRLTSGGGEVVRGRAAQRRRLAILTLLALAPKRTVTRERVMSLLWPDQAPDAARRNLNEALYVIRRELGADVIETRGEDLTLALSVGCDVDRFERAVAGGQVAEAVRACPGPLFGTWSVGDAPDFEHWAEGAREHFTRRFAALVQQAATEAGARGEWHESAALYARLRQADPESVTAVEGEARALARGGEPLRGLRVLDEFADRWRREFGSTPPVAVAAARAAIAAGAESPAVPLPVRVSAPVTPVPEVSEPDLPGQASATGAAPMADVDGRAVAPARVSPGVPQAPSSAGHGWRWALPLLAAAAVGLFALRRTKEVDLPPAPASAKRVAIVAAPLARSDSALVYLRDALTNGVINRLNSNQIAVASVSERRAVEEERISLDSLIALRQVGTLIELEFLQRDGQLQTGVRVLDATTRNPLASRTFARPTPAALAMETELVRFVADVLRRRLRQDFVLRDTTGGQRDELARKLLLTAVRGREDGEAVARSRSALDRGAAESMLLEADSLLVRALVQEPAWSTLWVERARIVLARTRLDKGRIHGALFDSAMAFVDSALARSPDDAGAYEVRGILFHQAVREPRGDGQDSLNLRAAEVNLRRATSLEPQRSDAWLGLSLVHTHRGEGEAAAAAARRAIESDAFVHDGERAYSVLIFAALTADKPDDAMTWCQRGRAFYPDDARFYQCELSVMRQQPVRADDEARAWRLVAISDSLLQRPNQLTADPYFAVYARAVATGIAARAGNRARARVELAALERLVAKDSDMRRDFLVDAAWIHLQLGDRPRAVAALRQMLREKPASDRQLQAFSHLRELKDEVMATSVTVRPSTR